MFFFPYRDDNQSRDKPWVTWLMMAICTAVFFVQQTTPHPADRELIVVYGVIPAHLFGIGTLPDWVTPVPAIATVFTSMFLHGGWMHYLGNMLYLWIFGDNVEDSMGHRRYLLFYLLCGAIAAFAQSIAAPSSNIPMIGASGAIAGVLGAYIILHPKANVRVLAIIIIFITRINVPAWIVLGMWFAGQLMGIMGNSGAGGGVAFLAHIGGFVAGAVLIFKFRRAGVPVFDKPHSKAFEVTRPSRARRHIPNSDDRENPWSRKGPWG